MVHVKIAADGSEPGVRQLDGPVVIGRGESCDIHLDDKEVSRRHCSIAPCPEGWVLTDLGSTNGTFVEGARVVREVLGDGDVVRIGKISVTFYAEGLEGARRRGQADRAARSLDGARRSSAPAPVDEGRTELTPAGAGLDDTGVLDAGAGAAEAEPRTPAPQAPVASSSGRSSAPAAPGLAPVGGRKSLWDEANIQGVAPPPEHRRRAIEAKKDASGGNDTGGSGTRLRRRIPTPVAIAVIVAAVAALGWFYYSRYFS